MLSHLRSCATWWFLNNSNNQYIATYINERKAKTPNDVAVLADEYVLTHKHIFVDQKQSDFGPKASVDKSHSGWDLDFSKQNTDSYMKNDSL